MGPSTLPPNVPLCALVVPKSTGFGSSDAGGTVGVLLAEVDVLVEDETRDEMDVGSAEKV